MEPLDLVEDPMERFIAENPLPQWRPEDGDEQLLPVAPSIEAELLGTVVQQEPEATPPSPHRKGRSYKSHQWSPLGYPKFCSPFVFTTNGEATEDNTPDLLASTSHDVNEATVPAEGRCKDREVGSNTPTLHREGTSEAGPVTQSGPPNPFDHFDICIAPLYPHGSQSSLGSNVSSDPYVLPPPGSQARHLRGDKDALRQVRTGRVLKQRGHQATASVTSHPSIRPFSEASELPLTSALSAIIPFVRLLEQEVRQLHPEEETMGKKFLRSQASSLSKQMVVIADNLKDLACDSSASGVPAGSVGGNLGEAPIDMFPPEPSMGSGSGSQY